MLYQNVALLFGLAFVFSQLAGRLERTWLSGPIVFVAVGLAFGPHGLGLLSLPSGADGLRALAELTLALVLFTDAANARLDVLRRHQRLPERALLIGLPLTILLGMAAGVVLMPHLGLLEVAVLATMLAPTDAALGKAVVSNPAVPPPIREGLNVESGLNDGICVPVLLALLAFATAAQMPGRPGSVVLHHFVAEIGIGLFVGLGLAWSGSHLLRFGRDRGWVTDNWRQMTVICWALTCFATAQWLGGSGFIACFAGGLLAGALARGRDHSGLLAAEGAGDLLSLLTWVLFGVAVVGPALTRLDPAILAYAVLSLTVVRMLPVFLALTGTGLNVEERLFFGWFGPRGLASVVFAVIALNVHLPGADTLTATVAWTVILSIVLHGITANRWAARLGRQGSIASNGLVRADDDARQDNRPDPWP